MCKADGVPDTAVAAVDEGSVMVLMVVEGVESGLGIDLMGLLRGHMQTSPY